MKRRSNDGELFAGRFRTIGSHQGGMARVFVFQDMFNDRLIAAKTPYHAPHLFSRECRLWIGLGQHPNIVKAHVVHSVDKYPYLFMDFIGDSAGHPRNLKRALDDHEHSTSFIIKVGIAVTKALRHAQTVFPGFVHRDLKPENILIDDDCNICVSDFGIGHISKNISDVKDMNLKTSVHSIVTGSTHFTEVGSFVGTVGYASPEQYFDSSSVSFKSDMYTLGVILFEALVGRLPYSPQMIEREGFQVLKMPLSMSSNLLDDRRSSLLDIIVNMLQFDPCDRPESLDAVGDNLRALRGANSESNLRSPFVDQLSRTVLSNRIYSLIQLEEYELATSNILEFQEKYPLSRDLSPLTRILFHNLPEGSKWASLRKISIANLYSPIKSILFILLGATFLFPLYTALSSSLITLPEFSMSSVLLFILFVENHINSKASITLDKITLPGIAIGIGISIILDVFQYRSIAGSTMNSIMGASIGLVIPLAIAYSYYLITKKEGLGGGAIKLLSMIGSWTGLMILPIIGIAALVLIFQGSFLWLLSKLPGELKWDNNTLCPRLYHNFGQIPTSTAIVISTWITISYSGLIDIIKSIFYP